MSESSKMSTFSTPGSHQGRDAEGQWFQHFYPVDHDACWCGWTPVPATVTVTAWQHGVLNPDGSWTVEDG